MRGLLWCGLFCCCLLVAGTAASYSEQLAQSEITALRARISSCWFPPPGIDANSREYVVLRVLFKTDGSMVQAPVLVEGSSSPLGPALAESAKRALLLCQPFTMLRPEHYDQWKDLELKFDPHELLGGGELKIGGRLPQEPNQTPAHATPPHDYRRLTLQLKPGMSEQDVTNLMGEANRDVLDVGSKSDLSISQMCALAEPCQRRGEHFVATRAQDRSGFLPAPSTKPCWVNKNKGRH